MPIRKSTYFPESALAHELLDGLKGLEIGSAAHNSFGLDTLNVDRVSHEHPDFAPYASEQMRLGGEVMPVDIVAPGDCIPVADQSFDFVISSHVIEHFYDPISAIKEWMRIATRYIFIICPQRDALESDRDKPLTVLEEHILRHGLSNIIRIQNEILKSTQLPPRTGGKKAVLITKGNSNPNAKDDVDLRNTDEHHSRWTCESFCDMCEWICGQDFGRGWEVFKTESPDRKVGNGFVVVLKKMTI